MPPTHGIPCGVFVVAGSGKGKQVGRALALAMGGGLCEMGCGLRRGGYWIRLRGILDQAQSIWDEAAGNNG